jgi:hypothetical protein
LKNKTSENELKLEGIIKESVRKEKRIESLANRMCAEEEGKLCYESYDTIK